MDDLSPAAIAFAGKRFTTASGFARCDCPYCLERVGKEDHKACLAVNVRTGRYNCWRCGARGRIRLAGEDGGFELQPAQVPSPEVIPPPEGFLELCTHPGLGSLAADEARDYLRSRGLVDEDVWTAARIGCCLSGRWGGRVVVPVLSPGGVWWGWVSRVWQKRGGERPYMTAPGMQLGGVGRLFNQAAITLVTEEPVLVVEGAFDALALWPDAVAVLGKPTMAQIATLETASRPVVIVLDGDAWEEAEMLALRLQFDGVRAGYVRLPATKDPDEVDRAWLLAAARQSVEVGHVVG